MKEEKQEKGVFGLCKGRHEIPNVTDYIFDEEIKYVFDFEYLRKKALVISPYKKVDLYVTGLTVTVIEVLRVAIQNQVEVDLYHFDRDTGNYVRQPFIRLERCGFCKEVFGFGWHCQNCGAQ